MLNQLVVAEVQNTTWGNIIVVSGAMLILLLLLKHFAWGSVSEMLKQREDKIANDIDSAEQSRLKAAALEQEREAQLLNSRAEAATIIQQAKDNGEMTRQTIVEDAKDEASRLKTKAQSDIAIEKDAAYQAVKDDVAAISLQIAEQILRKELSKDAHEALIETYIDTLGSTNETR
ncbi:MULTISPECIES: F0F1 ATP synthase subunit B [Enterococcus]|uniref:ATP synthase subunit b n=1 Tax=Enterococcus sulfureus ATCC 49903 TaxID=1140003 RepID=S0L471_9ENTE|nr:F0F1 ATP synthase subunit B [Enterococcus sulfureus]EOT47088.1 ATP synthase F0, B subunit [Enterococcus sulfureus ATCC 49903]EOT83617.1 ATP synthase F0, B subunit [Enterococcus sulfureus ATCC 49903]